MEQTFYQYIDSPLGRLLAAESGGKLRMLSLEDEPQADWEETETETLKQTRVQLQEYFDGTRRTFTIPLGAHGTHFQEAVWRELLKIPYGETRSYGQIAALAGSPKASRAVGMANHNNPIMILVPCHRVIGSDGKLVGYSCGLDKKSWLLELERTHKEENR